MKNIYPVVITMFLALGSISSFSSCEKDETVPPEIFFNTAQGYTSSDAVVAKETEVKIGINAVKASDRDFLTKLIITRTRNGGAASTVFSKNLTGVDQDQFSYDYIITTEDIASIDNYTFTVKTDDGLNNKVSFTLQVQ